MAQCRRTQPSCKAPTPSFFFFFFFFFTLVSLMPQVVAPQSPNFPFTHMRNHIPTVWHTLWQSRCHWSGRMCVTKHRRTQNNHVFLFGWEQSPQTKAVVSLLADLHKNCLLSNPPKSKQWGVWWKAPGVRLGIAVRVPFEPRWAGLRSSLEEMECSTSRQVRKTTLFLYLAGQPPWEREELREWKGACLT